MKVLFICGREPGYARNKVLLRALEENNISVITCTSSAGSYFWRYLSVVAKFLTTGPWRYQVILIGFLGHPLVFVIKPFAWIFRKPILLDAFLSIYDTLIWDRQRHSPRSMMARLAFLLDKWAGRFSDHVLLDTYEHIQFWVRTFGLTREHFSRVVYGADDQLFYPLAKNDNHKGFFEVEFHGAYQHLHGIDTILRAAKLLMNHSDIRFRMIGEGMLYDSMRELANQLQLTNVGFIRKVPVSQIPAYLEESDVCLGLFGLTRKVQYTIPNKAFEIIGAGRPLLTGDTPAAREFFEHRKTAYLSPITPEGLAASILELKKDPRLRKRLEKEGYQLFVREAKPKVLGQQIKEILQRLLSHF